MIGAEDNTRGLLSAAKQLLMLRICDVSNEHRIMRSSTRHEANLA